MDGKQSLLVVDDDQRLCRLLERILRGDGYSVTSVPSGELMFQHLEKHAVALVILDRMLPEGDGIDLAQRLRADSDIPIVMLTGIDQPLEKVHGLEAGADDYITKPFDQRELLARVRSVLRRSTHETRSPQPPTDPTVVFAGWTLKVEQRVLRSPTSHTIALTEHELRLLTLFIAHPNETLSRQQIMVAVMNREWSALDRSVDVLVSKLRRKLRTEPGQPELIQSVRGSGYRFRAHIVS